MWFVIVPAAAAALTTTGYAVRLLSDRAEDPETACLAHRDDDIAAVGESEDGKFDG